MKKFIIATFLAGTFMTSQAQIKTPAASPAAKVMQTVGLTDIEVEYSRPSVNDRVIFSKDGLVPFGEMWRTGANGATKVSFSEDVMVGGKDVKAGSYAVLTVPTAASWTVNFYPYESRSWSSYKEKEPAASAMATPKKTNMKMENFTISIDDVKADGATMHMGWANTVVPVKISVHTDKQAMASIDKVLAGPSKGEYYNIATYYHTSGKDLSKALEYVNMATAGDDKKFWQVRRKALILADMGKKKDAIKAAKLSLELATKADNKDYIKMNEASIKEWSM